MTKADLRGYGRLLLRILFLAAVCWALLTYVFLVTQVSGNDMFPAVKDGDLVIGFRLQQDYAKGDIIAYSHDGKIHFGRVAAAGGDVVTLADSGNLQVNGTAQSGEILYPTYPKPGLVYPYRVPDGHVFVLGDYRTQTEDSRDFGPIPLEQIQGKVITLLRRRGL